MAIDNPLTITLDCLVLLRARDMSKLRTKSEEKRALIQHAATELFCEKGFAATSMEQVAKQAGVSKQTVYSHFGSKDELFTDAISCKCIAHNIVDLVNDKLDNPQQALTEIATNFIALMTSQAAVEMHRTCVAESVTYPHVSRLFYEAGPERMINELDKVMSEFVKRRLLDIDNTRHAAVQFLCAIKGEICIQLEFNVETTNSPDQINQYIENTVAMFIRGYHIK